MAKYNDIDMNNWKQYDDIYTDTLWLIEKRDNSGAHTPMYHGNFVPQIPNQLLKRYTKKGDWILDPFLGSGTSVIEAQRLERNSVGIELQAEVATDAYHRIKSEKTSTCKERVYIGDSKTIDIKRIMNQNEINCFQFILFHPPYWDIIRFSDNPDDISNSKTLDSFLKNFGMVIDNTMSYLEKNRYCAVVIGDKYANQELVPLGFYTMNLFMQRGLKLKAILVKNFENTKGKTNQNAIWRYRALASDFYIFKHEYIFIFKKMK